MLNQDDGAWNVERGGPHAFSVLVQNRAMRTDPDASLQATLATPSSRGVSTRHPAAHCAHGVCRVRYKEHPVGVDATVLIQLLGPPALVFSPQHTSNHLLGHQFSSNPHVVRKLTSRAKISLIQSITAILLHARECRTSRSDAPRAILRGPSQQLNFFPSHRAPPQVH